MVARPSGRSQRALFDPARAIYDWADASWSPNGKWIALTDNGPSPAYGDQHNPALVVVNAATAAIEQVPGFGPDVPVWSPDSSRFAIGGSRLTIFSPTERKLEFDQAA